MLQRQQATAIIAARQKIVEGAVGMVEMALNKLNEKDIVHLDEERKTVLLRLSPKIWEDINRWAEEEFRSVNGQFEYLLQEALRKRKKTGPELDDNKA